MSAIPEDFIQQTLRLSEEVTRPFPNSRKIYVEGSRPDIRVPMREINQTDTPSNFGEEKNPPIPVYDTSGPYTDPNVEIDLLKGMPNLRSGGRQPSVSCSALLSRCLHCWSSVYTELARGILRAPYFHLVSYISQRNGSPRP